MAALRKEGCVPGRLASSILSCSSDSVRRRLGDGGSYGAESGLPFVLGSLGWLMLF